MQSLPPINLLRDRYTCDPEDGILRVGATGQGFRKNVPIGHAIGRLDRHGYLVCCLSIASQRYFFRVHRLVWAMYYGEFPSPDLMVDHINRVRTDNRRPNLRLVDAHANCLNSAATRKDASVPCNVSRVVRNGKVQYQAGKTYKGTRHYLGIYETPVEAAAAVSKWRPA